MEMFLRDGQLNIQYFLKVFFQSFPRFSAKRNNGSLLDLIDAFNISLSIEGSVFMYGFNTLCIPYTKDMVLGSIDIIEDGKWSIVCEVYERGLRSGKEIFEYGENPKAQWRILITDVDTAFFVDENNKDNSFEFIFNDSMGAFLEGYNRVIAYYISLYEETLKNL